jgi:succinoglycan biosynthesis protein ExoO
VAEPRGRLRNVASKAEMVVTGGFSVVMPLFNKAPHVAAAVASALNQTLPPMEVIVVDDGSTDGGPELVSEMDDRRLKLLSRSPPGPGGYAARNVGIENARGEWVAFLDADDRWHEDHLQRLAEGISACEGQVSSAFAGVELVFPERRELRPFASRLLAAHRPLELETMLRAWLEMRDCPFWTGAVAIRRDVLIDAGLFPAGRARRGGDKDLWLRAMLRGACVYSGAVTAEFHQVTVNRVSDLTPHTELPIVVETIAAATGSAPPEAGPLLRRLANLEIANYARYSAGRGAPVFARFARRLYYPEGLPTLAKLAAYYAAGLAFRVARRRK